MDRVRSGRTGSAVTGESPVAAPPAAAAKAPSIDFSAGNRCQAKVVSIAHEFKSKLKEACAQSGAFPSPALSQLWPL